MTQLTSNEILSKQREFFLVAIAANIFFAIYKLIAAHFFASSPVDYSVIFQSKICAIAICYEGFKFSRKGGFKSYMQYVFIAGIVCAILPMILKNVTAFQQVFNGMPEMGKIAYYACFGFCYWLVVILSLISSAMSKKAKWILCVGYLGFTSLFSWLQPICAREISYVIVLDVSYFVVYLAVAAWIYFYYTNRLNQQ